MPIILEQAIRYVESILTTERKKAYEIAQRILERYYPEIGRINISSKELGDFIPVYKIWKELEELKNN